MPPEEEEAEAAAAAITVVQTEACADAAAGMNGPPIYIMAAACAVCLIVGILLGTRARQIVASLKSLANAVRSFSFLIPKPADILGEQDKMDDGGEDDEKDTKDDEEDAMMLDNFMQPGDADPSLGDHPDVKVNPIMLYKIKVSKEQARYEQRRAALLAEGFAPEEVDERMEIEQMGGGGGGGGVKKNPLALFVELGARVEATKGGASADNAALQERRRLQRNVENFLFRAEGVEKFKPTSNKPQSTRDATGARYKTASEVATESAVLPIGGNRWKRLRANLQMARDARRLYRSWGSKNQATLAQFFGEGGDAEQTDPYPGMPGQAQEQMDPDADEDEDDEDDEGSEEEEQDGDGTTLRA